MGGDAGASVIELTDVSKVNGTQVTPPLVLCSH